MVHFGGVVIVLVALSQPHVGLVGMGAIVSAGSHKMA
jgi:hypothetical protein